MNRTDPTMPRTLGTTGRRELLHLAALTKQLWRINFSVRAEIAGESLRIPILYGQGPQNLALLEPGIFGALQRLFAVRAGAFIDVGVNVGQTLLKVKVLDPDRPYVGFETNPRCCQYVEELIRLNHFADCTLVPAGLSDRSGLTKLWLRPNVSFDPAATTISEVSDAPDALRAQWAAVCRGDEVLPDLHIEGLSVVKIDTEGAELEVLTGLAETVGRFRPFVVCEILPVVDERVPAGRIRLARQLAVERLLREWRYDVFRLHADTRLQRVNAIGVHDDLALSNYLFVPGEQRQPVTCAFAMCD
jgi:FkbM family methyltransferase